MVISFYFAREARKASREANEISKQLLVVEQQRDKDLKAPRLIPKESERDSKGDRYLVIKNEGGSEARNIAIWTDGVPVENHPNRAKDKKYIPKVLASGLSIRIRFIRFATDPATGPWFPRHLLITWGDADGQLYKVETELQG